MNLRTVQISYQVMYSSRNSPCKRTNEDEPTTLKKRKRKEKEKKRRKHTWFLERGSHEMARPSCEKNRN